MRDKPSLSNPTNGALAVAWSILLAMVLVYGYLQYGFRATPADDLAAYDRVSTVQDTVWPWLFLLGFPLSALLFLIVWVRTGIRTALLGVGLVAILVLTVWLA